jgi:pyruvate/oxaloacetate carboxyltransferase
MRNSLQNQLKEKDMRKMQEKLLNNAPDIQGTFGYPPLHASSTSNSNKNTCGSQKSQNVIAWEEQMRIKRQKLNKEKNDDELLRQRYEKECLEQRNMEISAKISNSQVNN